MKSTNKILNIFTGSIALLALTPSIFAGDWFCLPGLNFKKGPFLQQVTCMSYHHGDKKSHDKKVECTKKLIIEEKKLTWKSDSFLPREKKKSDLRKNSFSDITYIYFYDNPFHLAWWAGKLHEECGNL